MKDLRQRGRRPVRQCEALEAAGETFASTQAKVQRGRPRRYHVNGDFAAAKTVPLALESRGPGWEEVSFIEQQHRSSLPCRHFFGARPQALLVSGEGRLRAVGGGVDRRVTKALQ